LNLPTTTATKTYKFSSTSSTPTSQQPHRQPSSNTHQRNKRPASQNSSIVPPVHYNSKPRWSQSTSSSNIRTVNNTVKKEPEDIPVGNFSEDNTIEVLAQSYKKKLGIKDQANAEAKARIDELENTIQQQQVRIRELEQDERFNSQIVEQNLIAYAHDRKR
jgi:hypothetical protein